MVKAALKYAGRTDPGRVRRNNEDSFHIDADRGIFLVVDGIGGQAAGEKAAAIAVERLRARLERQTGATEQRIREAIAIANNEILKAARANPEWAGMACVLTVAVLENGSAVVGHVGDSRLYQIRRGKINKITHDHSPVGEREDKGEIGETEAMRHPRRNEVFRDVGSEEHEPDDPNFIEIQRISFDAESALLLCSDGLSDQVPAAEIQRALERHAGDPDAAARDLIDAANRAGGKDNVTVVVVEGEQFTASPAIHATATPRNLFASRPMVFFYGMALALAAAWFARPYFIPLPVVIQPRMLSAGPGARFDTIAAAMRDARPNDIVEVVAGEYREQVNLKSNVTLRSRVPREARLVAPVGNGPAITGANVHNARVTGFLIQGDAQAPLSIGILLDNSSAEVDGVDIEGANVGIEIRGAASPTLRGDAIHDCIAEGILIAGPSSPLISHNTFQRIKGPAIAARDGAKPELIGNVFEKSVLELPPDIPLDAVHEHNFMVDLKPPAKGGKEEMIAPASRKLGKYEILSKLGRGGMADVYLAQDTEANRTVALKLIEHSADADTRDAIEAERRGAELQARLALIEKHVVGVFEYGDVETYFFVAMEYIDGQDLAELMRHGPLEPEFAADTAIAVAETLENAHNFQTTIGGKNFHGIVHGDIKPKNVRIDAHAEVRVLDFGIAKALSLSRRLTRNEFGSVPYASPERLDTGDVNAQSDLWSLAVMLYEMLTGLQPYQADSTERLERMIRSRIPPPPAPDPCPDALRRILMKALANDPAVRYHSARDFANDIILFRTGGPIVAPHAAPASDPDATRRTTKRAGQPYSGSAYDDATRRTAPAEPAVAKPKVRGSVFSKTMRAVACLAIACVLYGGWSLYAWFGLHGRGAQLEREIKSEQLTDPDQIWTKWTELSASDPSSYALWGVRRLVDQKFLDAANTVIARYRNDTQAVYQKDWERAQTLLTHALAVNPDDETARGELRLCEGQIARFEGLHHHDADQLTLAAEKFNQAQQLLPKSADPQLGLASVYIYGLKDVDKADAALQEAARHGYPLGNREKLELADGYRDRGDRLFWDSRNIRGLPQEKEQISRAAGDYQRALDLYQSIVPYGNSNVQIKRLQASQDSVNTRLQEIH